MVSADIGVGPKVTYYIMVLISQSVYLSIKYQQEHTLKNRSGLYTVCVCRK